jgi:aminopeptidase N
VQESPHPAYLITLVVGQFHVHEDQWRNVPVTYWVPPDRAADVTATFGNTVRMLEFFSERIGVRYPWDQYAQVCCYQFGGGMENTSATTLGVDALCDATTRLDNDSDSLIAHELAHQWWGDLLTCREWPQLWLNEGFATYFEALVDRARSGSGRVRPLHVPESAGGAC